MTDLTLSGAPRILVPLDLSGSSESLFSTALSLALHHHGTVRLLHAHARDQDAVPWGSLATPRELLTRWGVLRPGASIEEFAALGIRVEHADHTTLYPNEAIDEEIARFKPALVVLGSHGRAGFDLLRFGSVAENLVGHCGVPALVVGDTAQGMVDQETGAIRLRKVLLPIAGDGFDQARIDALMAFIDLMDASSVEILLLHVGSRDELGPLDLPSRADLAWRPILRDGPIVPWILTAAEDEKPDVLLMGTRGMDGLVDRLLGTRSQRVVRSAPCPVLVVPVG